ncbi:hypothetical protein ACKS0A_07729 [Histoplasma ohiense]
MRSNLPEARSRSRWSRARRSASASRRCFSCRNRWRSRWRVFSSPAFDSFTSPRCLSMASVAPRPLSSVDSSSNPVAVISAAGVVSLLFKRSWRSSSSSISLYDRSISISTSSCLSSFTSGDASFGRETERWRRSGSVGRCRFATNSDVSSITRPGPSSSPFALSKSIPFCACSDSSRNCLAISSGRTFFLFLNAVRLCAASDACKSSSSTKDMSLSDCLGVRVESPLLGDTESTFILSPFDCTPVPPFGISVVSIVGKISSSSTAFRLVDFVFFFFGFLILMSVASW